MKESRLIFVNLKKGQLPLNNRAADAKIILQNASLAQRGLAPTSTAKSMDAANYSAGATPYTRPITNTTAAAKLTNERNAVLGNAANGLATKLNRENGQVTAAPTVGAGRIEQSRQARQIAEGATPQQIQQNQQNLRGIMNARPQGWIDTSLMQPHRTSDGMQSEPNADFDARKAAAEAQNTEKLKQAQIKQDLQKQQEGIGPPPSQTQQSPTVDAGQTATPDYSGSQSSTSYAKTLPQSILSKINADPDLAAALLPALSMLDKSNANIDKGINASKAEIDDGSAFQAAVTDTKDALKESVVRQEKAADKRLKNSMDAAETGKQVAQAEKDLFESKQTLQENDQRRQNTQNEIKNRRIANKLGVAQDTNGLQWMGEQIQKGTEMLNYLTQSGSAIRKGYMIQITRGYQDSVNIALENHEASYSAIESNYSKDLREQDQFINQDIKDRRVERARLEEKRWQFHNENDLKAGDYIKSVVKDREDQIYREERATAADEQNGWTRLESVIKMYGSYAPKSLLDSIAKQLPGVDVSGIASEMTLEQMKQIKIKSSGGDSTFKVNTSNVSRQALSEVVDRVTLSFGGTGAERNRKRGEYINRINSGESTESIMASMQADYWITQTGPSKTGHDERISAQSSMDSLQSFTDYYNISPENDGPLGQIDSRVQYVASLVGQSSESYNNIAGSVGNIRAKLIKDNYGSAVTPQELMLARSYIPQMTDKANTFLTKVQNLKAYNSYLDQKLFTAAVGLPPPNPPKPVTFSGTQSAGTGKFSNADLLNALK